MLTVNGARDAHSSDLMTGIVQAWYDQKEKVPEGVWVSCMNAIGEIRSRVSQKGRSWEETMAWFHVHHPVSILSPDDLGDEATSQSVEVSVSNQQRVTTDDGYEEYSTMVERLKMDMIATGRWILWVQKELRNMKEIRRMSKQHRHRAIHYIRAKEGMPDPIHTYADLQSRVSYLSNVNEKEFFGKYKESYNHNLRRRKFRAENFLRHLENHNSQLREMILR
jgi:hypothetical protein